MHQKMALYNDLFGLHYNWWTWNKNISLPKMDDFLKKFKKFKGDNKMFGRVCYNKTDLNSWIIKYE